MSHIKPLLTLFLVLTAATATEPPLEESLVQTAFLANKVEVSVVREKERDASQTEKRPSVSRPGKTAHCSS